MVSIVKVDQIQNADGTVEYLNAGSIKNASLHSSVTGGSGITALGTVASGTLNSSVNINSALSTATFPAGQVLFMGYDSYETQTTVGTTETPLMSVSWTTKGANSRVEAQATLRVGDYHDIQGYRLGLNINTGSSADQSVRSSTYMQQQPNQTSNQLQNDDFGNRQNTQNGYSIADISAVASKTTTYAKGTQVVVWLWIAGINDVYILRSNNRANQHESGICTLSVYEIAT